ncbi:Gfo/Idh/MocA family protein [Actinokineospora sp. HUAS TT18]|uniref:Gfo/Idh/MocA family protein n=1 Tax=Actinokineospora sp. HUAS TT18 TaxID=3447451 RepID=UPI003F51C36A
MTDSVRLALIGCGRQMTQNLVPFLQRAGGHQIVACVDGDLSLATALRARTGAATAVSSVDELDLATVDAAILAVPPEPSYRLTEQLVGNGIDCFVEKPAGHTTAALTDLDRLVRRTGRTVQIGFNFRYAETLQQLHELTKPIRATPSEVTIDFYSRHPSAPQWGVDTTLEAWIRHNGVHAFDLARWFVPAPVVRVDAHTIPCGNDRFQATVTLRHTDGSLSTLRIGNHTKKFIVGVSVQGVDGSRFTAPSLEQVTMELEAGTPSGTVLHSTRNLDHGWGRSGFGPELEAFLAACGPGDSPLPAGPSVADALAASELCDRVVDDLAIGALDAELDQASAV